MNLTFITHYLAIGVGVYLAAAAINFEQFKGADKKSILRGLLGIPGWPIALLLLKK